MKNQHEPETLSNVVILSQQKRRQLTARREMKRFDEFYLPAVTGVRSVMIRGLEADFRFTVSRHVPVEWWKTVRIKVTHIQSGRKFSVNGNPNMIILTSGEGEISLSSSPVFPTAYLGPDEFYRVDITTVSGMKVHFLADRVKGAIKIPAGMNAADITPITSTPKPPPLPPTTKERHTAKIIMFRPRSQRRAAP